MCPDKLARLELKPGQADGVYPSLRTYHLSGVPPEAERRKTKLKNLQKRLRQRSVLGAVAIRLANQPA